MRVRLQPSLVIQGIDNQLNLVDPINNLSYPKESFSQHPFLTFLAGCTEWRELALVESELQSFFSAEIKERDQTIPYLVEVGLLQDDRAIETDYALNFQAQWDRYGWEEPFLLHWHTNVHPKLNYSSDGEWQDREKMRKIVAEEPVPSNYKEITTTTSVLLKKRTRVTESLSIQQVFQRSVATSAPDLLFDFDNLSSFIQLSFGQTFVRELHVTGEHVAKTSPSGGSRHPIEIYPIVLEVDGLSQGAYHYNVKQHRLDLVSDGNYLPFIQQEIIRHPDLPGFVPKVVFVFSCLFERSMYRYRDARSYRVMQHDLGHLMQTAAMVASATKWGSYRGYSLNEKAVEKLLGIDGISESSFAFCVIG